MRNLKKILALVLAMVMVLSMMVTASATEFVDDADINGKYAEAVGVLSAIGVLNGFENADGSFSFQPNGNLTRAQAAKIVAYAKQGTLDNIDILADGVDMTFTDVPAWAKSCIAYLYSEGVINGRNATTFDPNGNVTGFELGKMLLVACGFLTGEDFAAASNWKIAVSEGLKKAGAWSGKDFLLSKELTREEACYLTFNMMNKSPAGTTTTYEVAGKAFTDIVEAYNYCKALNEVAGTDYDVEIIDLPTDSLMATVFPTVGKTATLGLGADKFGRPEAIVWTIGNKVVYRTYETPLAVVTDGSLDVTKTAKGEAWYGWTFPALTTVIYNGSVYNGTFGDLQAPGMTVELYGYTTTKGAKVVETIVAYDYYYATVTNIASNGNITLTVSEAGYVIANDEAKEIVVSAAKDAEGKQSADYLALAGLAKNDVVALCLKQDWDVNAWGTTVLAVETPVATTGTVTSTTIKLNGTTPVYSKSSITFNGVAYKFANQYARQNVTVGAEGTLYTLNGLVIGFVGKTVKADSDVIYVVDHFTVYTAGSSAVYDDYGNEIVPAKDYKNTVWVQGVNMDGDIVSYPVENLGKYSTANVIKDNVLELAKYTNNEQKILKYTKGADGHYTASAADKTASINVNKYAVADGTMYYDNAEYVYLMGKQDKLTVNAGSVAGAHGNTTAWAVYTGSNNKTVTKIYYWVNEAPVSYDKVFVHLGITTVPTVSIVDYDDNNNPIYGYTYTVLEDTNVMNVTLGAGTEFGLGFYEYYVEDGLHVVNALGVEDGVVMGTVTNIYKDYLTVGGFTNLDISDAVIFDLTESKVDGDKLGNNQIDAGEYVWFLAVYNGYGYDVSTIYILG